MLGEIKKSVDKVIKNIRIAISGKITSVRKNNSIFMQISDDEELRDIQVISPYGFYSLPLNGDIGYILFNNGSKKQSLVGIEHSNNPIEIDIGEALIYNGTNSLFIHLKNDGNIYIGNKETDFKNIARQDDEIEVNVPGIGLCKGKITKGSSIIKG